VQQAVVTAMAAEKLLAKVTPGVPTLEIQGVVTEIALRNGASTVPVTSVMTISDHANMNKRVKLQQYNTFEDAVKLIQASSNIIVVSGAGISTSLGIPDFRSEDGLYKQLAADLPCEFDDASQLFHIETFRENPERFYNLVAKKLATPLSEDGTPRFTPTHAFIRLLQDKGKLLTNYTQNIDGLELAAGIKQGKLIQAHGSIATGSCMRCNKQYSKNFRAIWDKGVVPKCGRCTRELVENATTAGMKRKRQPTKGSSRKRRNQPWDDDSIEEKDEVLHVLRPNITFFHEPLPAAFEDRLEIDGKNADLLIIIGTSLAVKPLCYLPLQVSMKSKPLIYISLRPLKGNVSPDIQLLGHCDIVVRELAKRLGWELKHEMIDEADSCPVKMEAVEGARGEILIREQKWKHAKKQ